ncbi:hypothetical protein V5O48_004415 [Marasmius crinis-equi]|uniref:F-box domain-containing protein n=1 Tax=Marasmius crinis-equi TaxID=585013 RepID=A0ABR3FQA4_9AGAR
MTVVNLVPYEIIRQIVESLVDNPPSSLSHADLRNLGTSSLISRSHWLAASRNLVWQRFIIPRYDTARFKAMKEIFSSAASTLSKYDVREVVYDGTDWFLVPGRRNSGGTGLLEWLGSVWHEDQDNLCGVETTEERFFGNVKSLQLRAVDLLDARIHEGPKSACNALEGIQALSPKAQDTFLRSFLNVTTLELRLVWTCSPEHLGEIVRSFPLLEVLVLDEIQMPWWSIKHGREEELQARTGLPLQLQTLEIIKPQPACLIDTISALTPSPSLRCFRIAGTAINEPALDAMTTLCRSSSRFEELSITNVLNEIENITHYTLGFGSGCSRGLLQDVIHLTLDVSRLGEFLDSLRCTLDQPLSSLTTLAMPKLQWAAQADMHILDETIPVIFPSLEVLEFVVNVAANQAEEESWQEYLSASDDTDGSRRLSARSEEGPAWQRAKRVTAEIASYLPTCAEKHLLRADYKFYTVDESNDGESGQGWM